jgi:hypothetical protein
VSVLFGNGNGSFKAATNFAAGAVPVALAAADVNGDGRPDLVTADPSGLDVSVLLGLVTGKFKAAKLFGAGKTPNSVAVADVNGDGLPDLVTASADNTVNVLLGQRNAATHFLIAAPVTVTPGRSFTITVTALTSSSQLDCLYTGTVTFGSSVGLEGLPANYTFTKADAGSHTFTVTLNTPGLQTLTVTDSVHAAIAGTASVTVNPAGATPPTAGGRSDVTATPFSASADASWAANLVAMLHSPSALAITGFTLVPPGHVADAPVALVVNRHQPNESGSALDRLTLRTARRWLVDVVLAELGDSICSEARSGDDPA